MRFFCFKLALFLCYLLFFSSSLESQTNDAEFTPIPKRKSTTAKKMREIIEIQEEVTIDTDGPIPKRRKDVHVRKYTEEKNKTDNRPLVKPVYGEKASREKPANVLEEDKLPSEIELRKKPNTLIITKVTNSIRNKLTECWNIPANMADKKSFSIKINLLLSPQGEVVVADVVDNNSYQSNPLFRSLADSAMRAVHRCSPFNDLPSEHYHIWREITLDFILNG